MSEHRSRFAVGDVVDGLVSRVLPFGAFVRIGGVDGLLTTQQPPQVGAEVRVRVVAIDDERERVAVEAV